MLKSDNCRYKSNKLIYLKIFMESKLNSLAAFDYLKKGFKRVGLEFDYSAGEEEKIEGFFGFGESFGRRRFGSTVINLDFSLSSSTSQLEIDFAPYFPQIKESGYRGNISVLAVLLRVSQEEILLSNHVQKAIDKKRYGFVGLEILKTKVWRPRENDSSGHFNLTFRVDGRHPWDTYFTRKSLDGIVELFV